MRKKSIQYFARGFFIVLTFLQYQTIAAKNQHLTYNNDAELKGGAFSTLLIKPKLVSGLLGVCKTYDVEFSSQETNAISTWMERNKGYLNLLNGFQEELDEIAKKENKPDALAQVEKYSKDVAEQVINAFSKNLLVLTKGAQLQRCNEVADGIKSGKLDIGNDAQLKEFLDKRIIEETAGNLSIQIECTCQVGSETSQSTPLTPQIQNVLSTVGSYDTTTSNVEEQGKQTTIFEIKFARHFRKQEGLLLTKSLFDRLDLELEKSIFFKVNLKNGGLEDSMHRITTNAHRAKN